MAKGVPCQLLLFHVFIQAALTGESYIARFAFKWKVEVRYFMFRLHGSDCPRNCHVMCSFKLTSSLNLLSQERWKWDAYCSSSMTKDVEMLVKLGCTLIAESLIGRVTFKRDFWKWGVVMSRLDSQGCSLMRLFRMSSGRSLFSKSHI